MSVCLYGCLFVCVPLSMLSPVCDVLYLYCVYRTVCYCLPPSCAQCAVSVKFSPLIFLPYFLFLYVLFIFFFLCLFLFGFNFFFLISFLNYKSVYCLFFVLYFYCVTVRTYFILFYYFLMDLN